MENIEDIQLTKITNSGRHGRFATRHVNAIAGPRRELQGLEAHFTHHILEENLDRAFSIIFGENEVSFTFIVNQFLIIHFKLIWDIP